MVEGVGNVVGREREDGDVVRVGEASVAVGMVVGGEEDRVAGSRVSGRTAEDSDGAEGRFEVVAVGFRVATVEGNGGSGRVEGAEDGSAVLTGSCGVTCRRAMSTCVLLRRAKPVRMSRLPRVATIPSSPALPFPFSCRLLLPCI